MTANDLNRERLLRLVSFYRGEGLDAAGRGLEEIWGWDDTRLEGVHDYIQWLFPVVQASKFNPDAPLLDKETIAIFRGEPVLRSNLLKSLTVMLGFYGLSLVGDPGTPAVEKAPDYDARKDTWQAAPAGYLNHNLLRLTRILDSLRLLGLEQHSAALYSCLEAIQKEEPARIPAKTLAFWKQAAGLVS